MPWSDPPHPFDTHGATSLDSPQVLCSETCKPAFVIGTNMGFDSSRTTADTIASGLFGISGISADLMPTEAEIAGFSGSFVDCICSLDFSRIGRKVMEHFVGLTTTPVWSKEAGPAVDAGEDFINTLMDGTPGSGGFCADGHCAEMVGSIGTMFSRLVNYLAHRTWESGGSDDGGNYPSYNPDPGSGISPPPPSPPPPETFFLFQDNTLSIPTITALVTDSPKCICSYFDPDSTGNVFPLIRRKAVTLSTGESEWGLMDIIFFAVNGFRSAKLCGSNSCRSLFDTFYTLVDTLANTDVSTPASPTVAPTECTSANSELCFSSACFPFVDTSMGGTVPSACAACYAAAPTTITQMAPMSYITPEYIDQTIFWTACFMNTDCPAAGVAAIVVKSTFTVDETMETFDQAAQDAFKRAFANILAPAGSDLEGTVTLGDILLTITAGSINVEAAVSTTSPALQSSLTATIENLTPATASSALGITVTARSAVVVETATFSPPAPPPPPMFPVGMAPPPVPPGVDPTLITISVGMAAGLLIGIGVGGAVGLCCCIGLIVFLVCMCNKKKSAKTVVAVAPS